MVRGVEHVRKRDIWTSVSQLNQNTDLTKMPVLMLKVDPLNLYRSCRCKIPYSGASSAMSYRVDSPSSSS